ncbi:MAG: SAM-dependent methyltransferase [Lachnospiraceae bacterium]|nr:SAM-dependent methyltransferase [Lachnospiraceae bacterium]
MVFSKRMQCVASMVTPGSRLADIGCDHAYIPIWLFETGRITMAVAMDIRLGPLERAKENIVHHGLEKYIQTRLSDGMEKLSPGEVNSAILAGIGGKLIVRILSNSPRIVHSLEELVLEPQSETKALRQYLMETGFRIESEDMVLEDGKFYPVIKAVPIEQIETLSEEQLRFGPKFLKMRHPVLMTYLQWKEKVNLRLEKSLQRTESQHAKKRLKEIQEEIQHIRAAYVYYDM